MSVALREERVSSVSKRILLLISLAFVFVTLFSSHAITAGDRHVVSIYADGQKQTFAAAVDNVAQALTRAEIDVADSDLVEPSLDTEINTDSFSINVYRARPIVVVDGDERYTVMSAHQSPRLIAESAGIEVFPEDRFTLERIDDPVVEGTLGQRLIIDRATPVTVEFYGNAVVARTHAATIGELIQEQDFTLDESDEVEPARETAIQAGMLIRLIRVGTEVISVEEVIAFSEEVTRDTARPLGEREVTSPGQNGRKLVTYEVTFHNNQEIGRVPLNELVYEQAVPQQVIVGVAGSPSPEMWAALRGCEAGGAYDRNSGNGYYGAYQFALGTWQAYGGTGLPHEAPPSVQDEIALRLWQARGFQPWPGCRAKLGLP